MSELCNLIADLEDWVQAALWLLEDHRDAVATV